MGLVNGDLTPDSIVDQALNPGPEVSFPAALWSDQTSCRSLRLVAVWINMHDTVRVAGS
jgi:hypothetical protein